MFSVNSRANIKEVNYYDNYASVKITTSSKRSDGKYEVDFVGRAKFYGNAFRKRPQAGQIISLVSIGVKNCYLKDGQMEYLDKPQYNVFDYELKVDKATQNEKRAQTPMEEIKHDDDLPF